MRAKQVVASMLGCGLMFALAGTVAAGEPVPAAASSTATSPEAVVDAQLAAYNKRDLDAFLGYYADDAVLAKYPDQVTQTGKAEMRARYERRFSNPNIRAEIVDRVVFGRFVIDHERVTAPPAKGELAAVAIYEVKDGKIVRVTFLEK